MFDILKYVLIVHVLTGIIHVTIIAIVAFLFTKVLITSIFIAMISYIISSIINIFINKKYLS